jgi:hypothetical protein
LPTLANPDRQTGGQGSLPPSCSKRLGKLTLVFCVLFCTKPAFITRSNSKLPFWLTAVNVSSTTRPLTRGACVTVDGIGIGPAAVLSADFPSTDAGMAALCDCVSTIVPVFPTGNRVVFTLWQVSEGGASSVPRAQESSETLLAKWRGFEPTVAKNWMSMLADMTCRKTGSASRAL